MKAIEPDRVAILNALFDIEHSLFEAVFQVPGEAYCAAVSTMGLTAVMARGGHNLTARDVHVVISPTAQSAASNCAARCKEIMLSPTSRLP